MGAASGVVGGRLQVPTEISEGRILVILRGDYLPEMAQSLGRALLGVGITAIEVTDNSAHAAACIEALSALGGLAVGAGTVLDPATVDRARGAGATFIVTPNTDPELISYASSAGLPVLAGAFTPTEALAAWRAGAAAVKLFPAENLGTGFIRALQGPFPQIPVIPTGGVDDGNAGDYLRAGALAVAVASWLTPQRSADLSLPEFTRRAEALRLAVDRGSLG